VLKRSSDGGRTWSRQQLVYEEGGSAEVTIGNPAPVVDQDTGVIWLPFCRDNDRVLMTHSTDDGLTWASPADITGDVKEPDWTWYATGPVNGIQLRRPPHRGRLIIPCDHRVGGAENSWNHAGRSHAIYSDDHGKSWQLSKPTGFAMNECTVAERSDGTLLLNMRSYRGRNRRAVATSGDGGVTWSASRDDPKLIEPVCQGSMIRYTWPGEAEPGAAIRSGKSRILFSNPDSTTRDHMTVRLSYDEGQSWPVSRLLHEGPAAYSGLCALPDQSIGNLYERGSQSPYETITFARFTLAWLTRGRDRPWG
jgi:sialidase-1